ncbi:NAD dependent epimerase/dehydratase [Aspergillus affinis]|uniref:NAD dependent epimerase/dehydratase n=1 Tax=Aspergillus affinis TaxID=1070780 RepID=UPI0022FE9939|nr:NAD dependent epimerase/dehydratase [Aspergillus affinis]KAI9043183.1 NAD dependent epimerase/dehydratase [Aspergillus affinis]
MPPVKLLLVGATGFIGGSILHELLETSEAQNANVQITVAVRQPDQAEILSKKGVRAILIAGLDDADGLENAASDHDIVINSATGQHTEAPKALIRGLGKRKEQTGRHAITPSPYQLRSFSDEDDDLFDYEKSRAEEDPYGQRVADVVVVEEGIRFNVKTYIVMPPTVYGNGTGLFKKQSHQIPTLIRSAIKSGHAEYIGTGEYQLGHVHVTDLARLFSLLATKVVAGETAPSGRQGYYFTNTGNHQWVGVANLIGKAGFGMGVLQSPVPRSISLEEGAVKFADGDVKFAEACFASSSSSLPRRAFGLGWKPIHTEDFKALIKTTFEEIRNGGV